MRYLFFLVVLLLSFDSSLGQNRADTTEIRRLARKIKEKRYWSTSPDSINLLANRGLVLATAINDQYGVADMHKYICAQVYWHLSLVNRQ
jgi:hypothetical protein